MKRPLAIAACALVAFAGCGDESSSSSKSAGTTSREAAKAPVAVQGPEPKVALPEGAPPKTLVVRDLKAGTGEEAKPGDELTTQFVAVYVTGKRLESSWEDGQKPFVFRLGADEASPGWERGIPGMRVGGRRELIIPPKLSSRFGVPPNTSPSQTLVYVVDLLAVNGETESAATRGEPRVAAPQGSPPTRLVVDDLIEGSGAPAEPGDELTVEYVGIHYDGAPFTNSWDRAKPFEFELGDNSFFVNPGWEKGLQGMRVGGRRELIVPPDLLYQGGAPPGSKPEDTLVYVIDLQAIG